MVQFVRQAVKEEVSIAVREQSASISDSVLEAMRSGAMTPIQVTPDPHQAQTQILGLLRQGQLNAAFQEVRRLAVRLSVVTVLSELLYILITFFEQLIERQHPEQRNNFFVPN